MKTLVHFLHTVTLRQAVSLLLIVCMLHMNAAVVQAMSGADPKTPNVNVGPINATGTTTVTIDPGIDPSKAIINWKDLNINDKQILEFVRNGGAFTVLNRDMQSAATRIDGTILGHQGHIIVINQNGVIFGPSSMVEAQKFTAGAMKIDDQDFLKQDTLKFIVSDGAVENLGKISAEQVALIGKEVINRGIIQTPKGGFVVMASADEVYLADSKNSNVLVQLSSTPEFQGQVTNEQQGKIEAPEGTIILAAGDLYVQALDDLSGLGASVESGKGRVGQFGTLVADGVDANGGNIALTAGDTVALGDKSVTSANAAANGDGGQVIAYTPGTALFREGAKVEAKGGSESGNGGFFDLSGKSYVEVAGDVDMTAANGKNGSFLIDPRNIKIVDFGWEEGDFHNYSDLWKPSDSDYGDNEYSRLPIDRLEQYLSYSSVILETDYSSDWNSQTGWVWFDAGRDVRNFTNSSLTVNAENWIRLDSGIHFYGHGDINLNANTDIAVYSALVTGGDLTLFADYDHNVMGDVYSSAGGALTAGGNIGIFGNDIDLGAAVAAGDNLIITGRDCESKDPVWGNIHARDTLTAGGNIEISDTGKEQTWVDGHWEGWGCFKRWVPGFWQNSYAPGTITLDGDVTAGGNLSLFNDTYTASGVTLQAGRDVFLMNDNAGDTEKNNMNVLQGTHQLTIIAGAKHGVNNGEIHADNTVISVSGSALTMQQDKTLDTSDYQFANQEHTDLTLISKEGSVIAASGDNAASEWNSIGATADDDIYLKGNSGIKLGDSGTDHSKSLLAVHGNIDVIANGNVDSRKDIHAGSHVEIMAGPGKIYLGGDVTTNQGNITFHDKVIADGSGDQKFDAGGFGSDLIAKGDITKVTGGDLTLDASNHTIFLAGDVTTENGDLNLNAPVVANGFGDQKFDAGGQYKDLTAKGDITKITKGDLTLDAGRDPQAHIYLAGDVKTHDGDITFEDDVIANGCGDQKFDAGGFGSDLIAKDDIAKVTGGDLTLDASNHTIYLAGDVTTENGNLNLNAPVVANGWGDQKLDAGGQYKDLTAKGDITKVTNGDLTLDAGKDPHAHIYLAGDVKTHNGDLTFEDDVIANGCGDQKFDAGGFGSDLIAKDDIAKVTGGDLTLDASNHTIFLAGDVTTENGNLNLNAPVVANGFGDQKFDAGGQYKDLTAKGDITKVTSGDLTLDAGKDPFAHIYLAGDVKTHNGDINFEDDVIANGWGDQKFDAGGFGSDLTAKDDISKVTGGDLTLDASNHTIYLAGNVTTANGDLNLNAPVVANGYGDQRLDAGGFGSDLTAKGDIAKVTNGDLNLDAGRDPGAHIILAGDVKTHNGNLTFEDDVIANGWGDQKFDADGYGKKLIAQDSISKPTCGDLTLDGGFNAGHEIELNGDVTVARGNLYVGENGSYNDETLVAAGKKLEATHGDIRVASNIDGEGDLTVTAGDDISVYGNVNAAGQLDMQSGQVTGNFSDMMVEGDVTALNINLRAGEGTLDGYDSITIYGNTEAVDGSVEMVADDDIFLGGNVTSPQHVGIYGNADKTVGGVIGDVTVAGDITAGEYVEIDAADDTIYLGGSTHAGDYIWLMANANLNGDGDQTLEAGNWIGADGFVRKCTWGDLWMMAFGADENNRSIDLRYTSSDPFDPAASTSLGNLWIIGQNDIQISGDVTTFGPFCKQQYTVFATEGPDYYDEGPRPTGGVLIYAMDGSIYTEGSDGLNVNVTGNSDHWNNLGVYNPDYTPGEGEEETLHRAAIVIASSEDLILGPNGSLNAFGTYYDDVDDRAMINFLDVPANIGGYDRNEGDPFDLAIYVASLDGNVHVDMPTQILSTEWVENPIPESAYKAASIELYQPEQYGYYETTPKGAMVIDALDTVTFGPQFEASLAGDGQTSQVGDRLEVVSRISEWLEDAYGRLPYANPAEGPGPFPAGYNYVLRGAGLENPEITDGRAWVLENRPEAAPLYHPEAPRLAGCPLQMDAASAELGIHTDQLQVAVSNSLAIDPTINPCDACDRLISAANVLKDNTSARMADMAYVFNQIAPADMPFTPEMGAAIATAFSNNAASDSRYASAMEYVDAFVQYVTVVSKDFQAPNGDPVAQVMQKYGNSLLESGNGNMAAYVMMQIQQ